MNMPIGMGVVAEALHQLLDVLVDERVVRDLVGPVIELVAARQLAEEEQVGGLEIGARARPAARSDSRGSAGCPGRRR